MQSFVSVLNFDDGDVASEINSPRSLEACLRAGFDPKELQPKSKKELTVKGMSEDMIETKYQTYEKRRKEKVAAVKKERDDIIGYGEKIQKMQSQSMNKSSMGDVQQNFQQKQSTMMEIEQKRLETLKRRQEQEIAKIVAKEQMAAELQRRLKQAEDDEIKKKKEQEKKAAEAKKIADKKKAAREAEIARAEKEEEAKRKALLKKEAALERKLQKQEEETLKKLEAEAKIRDAERAKKLEEHRLKTEAAQEELFKVAEQNRIKFAEREAKVKEQLEEKKEATKQEMQAKREIAAKRIKEALDKHHQMHDQKKHEFLSRTQSALQRTKELEAIEKEKLKKQADERERKNKQRYNRLLEAVKQQQEYKHTIVEKLDEKNKLFDKIKQEKEEEHRQMMFQRELKMQELKENVDRMGRIKEFSRLQTLQKN